MEQFLQIPSITMGNWNGLMQSKSTWEWSLLLTSQIYEEFALETGCSRENGKQVQISNGLTNLSPKAKLGSVQETSYKILLSANHPLPTCTLEPGRGYSSGSMALSEAEYMLDLLQAKILPLLLERSHKKWDQGPYQHRSGQLLQIW